MPTNAAPVLTTVLHEALGGRWQARPLNASGFCATWRAESDRAVLFVKTLPTAEATALEAEQDGLEALAATRTVRVPSVAACWRDTNSGLTLLALEWLDLQPPDAAYGGRLGLALGALHRAAPADGGGRFGWRRDNLLGVTPQPNRWSARGGREGWIQFFGQERLGAMAERLATLGGHAVLVDAVHAVVQALPAHFDDGHEPRPSLIHGDLWSGNWGMLADGTPVIYDPAVSCSDAEAELAMMELFGSPPAGFWPAYRAAAGLHAGYAKRLGLYQLYHLLNHALLFGGGYASQAYAMAQTLLRP